MKKLCFAVMAVCMLLSCGGKNEKGAATEEATLSGLMKSDFVSEVDGKPTALYVLKNKKGLRNELGRTLGFRDGA